MKKLHLFVSAMGYDEGKSGISDYINHVVSELVKNHRVDLLIMKNDVKIFPVKHKNLKFIEAMEFLRKPLFNMIWHLFMFPAIYNLKKYDAIFLPAANRRIFYKYPIPTIVTFHDLSQIHISNKYDAFRMFYVKKVIPFFLKKANRICSISNSTSKDLISFYRVDGKKIFLNYNGFDKSIYNNNQNNKDLPLCLPKKYFLYIARVEHPGKNHLRLIKAYEKLPEKIKGEYDLIFAGKIWSGAEPVIEYAKQSKYAKNIHILGFVDSKIIPELYKKASLYIFPSLFEGFGIPLLEAMSSGIPVICSDRSSLPEIGGNAVITFNPENIPEICESIVKVINDDKLKEEMIRKGFERCREFDWLKHTDKLLEEFNNIINDEKH